MQLTVSGVLNQFQRKLQGTLFPTLQEQLGPLSDKHRQLAAVLSMIEIEALVGSWSGGVGRPARHRRAMARALVAKAVFNLSATRQLLDRLLVDVSMRRLCGWESRGEIPHESQFSRAFAEFAASELPQRLHEALIKATQQERLIGHISRDSTEIEAREKPVRTPVSITPAKSIRKRGRPKKGEQTAAPEPTRMERQTAMTLEQMLDDLPRSCNVGSKNNSKGYKGTSVGYKLHLDVADGQIPISCILTSASLHDSQAAIPLARLTAQRITHLYDLMDSAYDAQSIHEHVRGLGHIPIIDAHPRRDASQKAELQAEAKRQKLLNYDYAEGVRYRERTTVERVNARLKDEFGGRTIRVRGNAKVMCHLMFGIVALAADQILRLIT
ncbi:MAG TPA: transposase [Terracidiphilus sp.]|nr:transposase [Terracidiphilus sp.]